VFKILILALVQGLTEFLPVSSSGHLALISHFLPKTPDEFYLAVFLHGGTLLATIIYFWPDIVRIFTGLRLRSEEGAKSRGYLTAIIVGSIPVAVFGLLLKKQAESIFTSLPLLAVMFLITGLVLAVASLKNSPRSSLPLEGGGKVGVINPFRAFIIGCAQLVAVLPGISRSGSTISAGLISGLSRQEAFRFSFLLSLPAVAGAFLVEIPMGLPGGLKPGNSPVSLLLGFVVSCLVGLLALHILRRLVLAGRLAWFSVYLLVLGLFTVFL
jgi:undecaprenyl-diphosphatase